MQAAPVSLEKNFQSFVETKKEGMGLDCIKKVTKTNYIKKIIYIYIYLDFPGGPVVKSPSANAENTDLIPGPGRSHMPWGN